MPYSTLNQDLLFPAYGKTAADYFLTWPPQGADDLPYLCAEFCHLAYADEVVVTAVLQRIGYRKLAWFNGQRQKDARGISWGTDGFVAHDDAKKRTFVVFRGTEATSLKDIVADLRAWQSPWQTEPKVPNTLVHNGFQMAYQSIKAQLGNALPAGDARLIFTGHSLGAAVATLAAADQRASRPLLLTFGLPRVGNQAFIEQLAGINHRRYVDCCDVVTRVPPESFSTHDVADILEPFLGGGLLMLPLYAAIASALTALLGPVEYRHFGELHYIDRDGAVHRNPEQAFITADQQAARNAYAQQGQPANFDPTQPLNFATPVEDVIDKVKEEIFKKLFGPSQVPFRDTADHAPINYVRSLT
jgi:hypothetical protein